MTLHQGSRWGQTQTISQLTMAWVLGHKVSTGQVGSRSTQKRFSTSLFRLSNPRHQFLAEPKDHLSCKLQMFLPLSIKILHPKQI